MQKFRPIKFTFRVRKEDTMKNHMKKIRVLLCAFISLPAFLGFISLSDFPSDVIPFFDEWRITMGNGNTENDLINYEHADYFYDTNDGEDWVVYKTPNGGGTTPNSSNTRSELRHVPEWTPEDGGRLTGTLKVMHVSTSGDARVNASYTVVIGQIHSNAGHENEPLKIFYKKYPGHSKGSVFWNYEINTQGSNSGRWDYSTSVWGLGWPEVGSSSDTYPPEPEEGITLGEEFSYEINVYNGIMYLTFESAGHETKTFAKSLVSSAYSTNADIPQQVLDIFAPIGQDGVEQADAYAGENQYFKQGAYNQANGSDPANNIVWNTGSDTYDGDLAVQYANGSYAEVWFKEATVGPGINPYGHVSEDDFDGRITVYPNPAKEIIHIDVSGIPNYEVKLYDLFGKLILQSENQPTMKISAVSQGIYLLEINDLKSHQKSVERIVIRR